MELLRNPIRDYAWGSRSALARMQGRPAPTSAPEAELWIGAHPATPSVLAGSGASLADAIAGDAPAWLGAEVASRYGPRLPYLLKVLAADAPLSLQAHPDASRARSRFEAGDPNYVDGHHKPELLVALTPFEALCGFRDTDRSAAAFQALGLSEVAAHLERGDLRAATSLLLSRPAEQIDAGLFGGRFDADLALVRRLAAAYPGDPGVLVALLLNPVTLAPGEAVWMPAGNLHAYLRGVGVEVMAASDNVLRGGLTPKRVDVAELLRVLRFEVLAEPVVKPVRVASGVVTWPVPVDDFALHHVRLGSAEGARGAEGAREPDGMDHAGGRGAGGSHGPDGPFGADGAGVRGVEGARGPGGVDRVVLDLPGPRVVLCTAGKVTALDGAGGPVALTPGQAAIGRAGAGPVTLTGDGEAFVASARRLTSYRRADGCLAASGCGALPGHGWLLAAPVELTSPATSWCWVPLTSATMSVRALTSSTTSRTWKRLTSSTTSTRQERGDTPGRAAAGPASPGPELPSPRRGAPADVADLGHIAFRIGQFAEISPRSAGRGGGARRGEARRGRAGRGRGWGLCLRTWQGRAARPEPVRAGACGRALDGRASIRLIFITESGKIGIHLTCEMHSVTL